MSDGLLEAIRILQRTAADVEAQRSFALIVDMARREPDECAAALSRAVLAEQRAGALRTPRLLTLLGLTRMPAPECAPVCLDLLRALPTSESGPPADAALGAAAIVARTQPRTLLPDLSSSRSESQPVDDDLVPTLFYLLSITNHFLHEMPDSAFTDMARWLWRDCAELDLMTLVDFVGVHVERSSTDDAIVGLIVDLIERVPASADQKRYTAQRLKEVGVDAAMLERVQNAARAMRVAPAPAAGSSPVVDPEAPAPEPRVDDWLTGFSEGDEDVIELARAALDEMFESRHPPIALPWWTAVTVDAGPAHRRSDDVDWALLRFSTLLRGRKGACVVPPSVLVRWLDAPQLLSESGTIIALDLLSRQQPGVIVHNYLHRAVAASDVAHPGIVMGEMWRALTEAAPSAVLFVASRWIAFGFGQSALLDLLIEMLIARVREAPTLIDELARALEPTVETPPPAIDVARDLLDELRKSSEDLQS